MIKTLFASLLFLGVISHNGKSTEPLPTHVTESTVYICNSTTAKKYHYKKSCRGLNACNHDIKSVSLSDARDKYSRTLCGWED